MWLIFIRLFRLLAKTSHIRSSRLLLGCRLILSWWLTLWRNFASLRNWRRSLLAINRLFRLLLFWLFIFRRNGIENSCWFYLFLILCKGCYVNCFTLVFFQSSSRILNLIMLSSPMPSIWLSNSFDVKERDVKLLFNFFN